MSGLSLAVGPRPGHGTEAEPRKRAKDGGGLLGGLMGSLRTIELQLVAFIVVFSASGLVPIVDLLFPVFTSIYVFILSRYVFPSYPSDGKMEVFHGSRMFQLYVVIGTVVGLFLPLGYVLGGFARGDQHAVRAATPHLFLLSFQVLSENIISGLSACSPPVRVLVALIYSVRRIFALADWLDIVLFHTTMPSEPRYRDVGWIWFGRWLAAANFIYFNVNMFCFLIPRFLPRAFERYLAAKAAYTGSGGEKSAASNTKSSQNAASNAKASHDKAPAVENKANKKTQ